MPFAPSLSVVMTVALFRSVVPVSAPSLSTATTAPETQGVTIRNAVSAIAAPKIGSQSFDFE